MWSRSWKYWTQNTRRLNKFYRKSNKKTRTCCTKAGNSRTSSSEKNNKSKYTTILYVRTYNRISKCSRTRKGNKNHQQAMLRLDQRTITSLRVGRIIWLAFGNEVFCIFLIYFMLPVLYILPIVYCIISNVGSIVEHSSPPAPIALFVFASEHITGGTVEKISNGTIKFYIIARGIEEAD